MSIEKEPRPTTRITNYYIEEIKNIFLSKDISSQSIDMIINMLQKANVHYLVELAHKLPL